MRVNVVSDTRRGTTPTTACLHSTFVKQFRYTPDIVTLFERRRESLLTLKHAGDRLHAAWQSMPPAAYPFLREGSLVVRGCTPYVVHEVVDARVVGSEDTEVDDERLFVRISLALKLQAQAKVDADADDGDTQLIHHTFSADVTSRADAARSFEHWVRSREEAERAVERACAPPKSTEVARGTNGRLRSLRALPEYLEKSCIRYWSVQELRDALETRTRRPTDVYRPYFLIVLRAVLRTFDCVSANIPHVKWSEVRVG
jgi:hypothetical protein